jgi:hypothetical protein
LEYCNQIGSNDDEVDSCLLDFLQGGYADSNESQDIISSETDDSYNCDDPETECLLDNMYEMWDQDLPALTNKNAESDLGNTANKGSQGQPSSTIKPWNSRSSPSGTFVRDPATGQMRNIDAQ